MSVGRLSSTGVDLFFVLSGWVLCKPYLMKLGVVAYGTYLLHYLFMDVVRFLLTYHRERPPAGFFIGADVLGIFIAIAFATVSWRWFEKPLVQRARAYNC